MKMNGVNVQAAWRRTIKPSKTGMRVNAPIANAGETGGRLHELESARWPEVAADFRLEAPAISGLVLAQCRWEELHYSVT